jgi:hypothetical protein
MRLAAVYQMRAVMRRRRYIGDDAVLVFTRDRALAAEAALKG